MKEQREDQETNNNLPKMRQYADICFFGFCSRIVTGHVCVYSDTHMCPVTDLYK